MKVQHLGKENRLFVRFSLSKQRSQEDIPVKKAICYSSVLVSENQRQRLAVIKDVGFDGIEAPQFDTAQKA